MVCEPGVSVTIDASFVREIDAHYSQFPGAVKAAFPKALNEGARFARKVSVEAIMKDTAFPTGYLDKPERFYVAQFATPEQPQAVLKARTRGTLLYEFAVGHPLPEATRGTGGKNWFGISTAERRQLQRSRGVTVIIKPGAPKTIPEAFVIPLKDSGALGIAVKLKNGQFPAMLKKNFIRTELLNQEYYVLYGPSVDQVFRQVSEKVIPEVTSYLSAEFRRLFFVELGK